MNSLPWIVAVVAVIAAAVGTAKLRERETSVAPETPARLVAAARSDVEKSRFVEAIRSLRGVPETDRAFPRAKEVEGQALLELHFVKQAEDRFSEAIKLEPTLDDAPFHLFGLYFLSGRHEETRRLAVELAPKQTSPSFAAAMLLEVLRQEHERAATPICLETFEPVLVREPGNGVAMRVVGRCYVELGRVTDGLALLKGATEKLPNDAETWAVRFESMHDAGRSQQVVTAYKTAPDSLKKHHRVLRAVAAAYDAAGDSKTAEEKLLEAVKQDPFDRKARTQLASMLNRRGDAAAAKMHSDRAKELDSLREQQASLLQKARGQNKDPGPDLLRKLAKVCTDLGWADVGGEFDRLAKRRAGRSAEITTP